MADKVTIERIKLLHPKLRDEATQIYNEICTVLTGRAICRFAWTLRTFAEQDALYAQGRTTPGKIVTKAKAGQSFHNYGLACFDNQTRIVTNKGIKYFYELDKTEEVLTFKNGILEWQKPLAYISNQYSGDMVSIKTRSVDLLVTPNHKMVVGKKNSKGDFSDWFEIEANELSQKYRIPTGGITSHNTNHKPIIEYYKRELNIENSLDWYEFIGYYLSEGSSCGVSDGIIREHSGRHKVSIYQSKEKNNFIWNKIKNCLDRLKFNYTCFDGGFYIHSKALWEILFPLGNSYTKRIPEYMFYADIEHLERLYYALIDGDGSYYETHESYFSVNKQLSEDVVTIMLLIGKSASISERIPNGEGLLPHGEKIKPESIRIQYQTNSRERVTHELRNGDGEKLINNEYYSGIVYCVTTNAGAIVIERNNKFSIAGNCDIVLKVDRDHIAPDGVFESASWENKVDFDGDGIADWEEIVGVFKRYGWEWGGDWKFTDLPHFQKTFGKSVTQLMTAHNAGNFLPGTDYIQI